MNEIEILKQKIESVESLFEKSNMMNELGDLTNNIECYHNSFVLYTNSTSLYKLADHFFQKNDYLKVICYLKASLEIDESIKTNYIWMLYYCYWYIGRFSDSKKYFDMCISLTDIEEIDERFLNDYRFYYELPIISIIGDCDLNIIYPTEKIDKNFNGKYFILSENLKNNSSLMIEYIKKINNKESKLLTPEEYDSDYKVIYL